jgi:tRNA wybutosine-synthesizing protein 1
MTPSLGHCTQSCFFCWRATPENLGVNWNQSRVIKSPDMPEDIVQGCIDSHKQALSGFGGNVNVDKKRLEESLNPVHVAISLEGEPTLYPLLSELIEEFFRNRFKSIFVVTNGTNPETLSSLETEPSQLYVSACAPDEETYRKTCRPLIKDGWIKHLETLELLNSFSCPTVLRHTLIPGFNMKTPEKYAKLAHISNATYLEPKGAMSVGFARKRFGYNEMAWYSDILKFSENLSEASGYAIVDEQKASSIVLLSRLRRPIRLYVD